MSLHQMAVSTTPSRSFPTGRVRWRTVPICHIAPPLVSSRRGDSVTHFFYSFFSRYSYRPERIPSSHSYIPSPVQRQPSATLPIVIWQSDEP